MRTYLRPQQFVKEERPAASKEGLHILSAWPPQAGCPGSVSGCTYDKYCGIRYLSNGSYGRVILANKSGQPNQHYALKIIPKSTHKANTNEISILKDLKGTAGVVQYVEDFETENDLVIVTEFCEGQELFDYLTDQGSLPESIAKHIFQQLCTAMSIAHKKDIVHRDLKPENIIIYQHNVTIIDWGLAFYPSKTSERSHCGSPCYASPEVLAPDSKYDGPELDVWSLGCVLYVMLTAYFPFDDDYIPRLFKKIRECTVDYNNLSEEAADLLRSIFTLENRASITEVLNDRWLNSDVGVAWY